jgi:hypothetical protein
MVERMRLIRTLKRAFLITSGFFIVLFGVSRVTHGLHSNFEFDNGIAHADAPPACGGGASGGGDCAGDSGGDGSSCDCGGSGGGGADCSGDGGSGGSGGSGG